MVDVRWSPPVGQEWSPELLPFESGREQTRARYPDVEGYVTRGGVSVFFETYGLGEPTI
jgi:hypothetical protein